ncbi:ubiquitin-conjugating enzyme E2-binding protein [Astrocystis sublimbata]|nr:ubiquitin-conjugating enzyme E2-binding protein [Astrocystis sublimbata]
MSASPRILIYAELLSNIRQISIGCTLPTPVAEATRASIATDGRTLTVAHDGSSATIRLPENVTPASQLPIREVGEGASSTRLSWRPPLAAPATARRLSTSAEDTVPWSAVDIRPGSAVACRPCQTSIVDADTLKVWKDLPSENWAEMMEFWHCHKPHDHQKDGHDEENLTNRGYGASSRITAQSGIGFVDLTSFLLAESDMVISAPEETNEPGNETKATTTLHCTSCRANVGVRNNEDASSVSLFKWQVSVQQPKQAIQGPPPGLAQCVSAMLLATMARSGCSKSILLPIKGLGSRNTQSPAASDKRDLLNIWVFNANITYSSTEAPASPASAIKVFYRSVTQKEADKLLDSMTSDVQDISLPSEAIAKIGELLVRSNSYVPESDRRFKEWTVGLLAK